MSVDVFHFVGKRMKLEPQYGWGWDPHWPWAEKEVESPLYFVLEGVTKYKGNFNGGFGQLIQPHCLGNEMFWIFFELHSGKFFDFENKLTPYVTSYRVLFCDIPIDSNNYLEMWDSYRFFGYCLISNWN